MECRRHQLDAANALLTSPNASEGHLFEKRFLQGRARLDGADRFAFEEFGVGSEAEGCQYVGLYLL